MKELIINLTSKSRPSISLCKKNIYFHFVLPNNSSLPFNNVFTRFKCPFSRTFLFSKFEYFNISKYDKLLHYILER